MNLKILFFGDVVGRAGREALKKTVPQLKETYQPELAIANAENLAHGKGVTSKTLEGIQEAGIDIFTSGNHIWKKTEGLSILNEKDSPVIRPANYPPGVPGKGYKIIEIGTKKVLIINLMGRVFIQEDIDCPFRKLDEILEETKKENLKAVIVDFHGEATSEKIAFGWYADGRTSAVIGTHTHIVTADEKILPKGTAYITDAGMVGLKESVLGVDKDTVIKRFLTQLPLNHEIPEEGLVTVNALYLEIDTKTSKAKKLERIKEEVVI